jgi:surfactin synthase thioesterase subunit
MVSFPDAESGCCAALILLSMCGRDLASATDAPLRRNVGKSLSDLPKGALVERLRKFNGAPEKALQNDELLNLMSPKIRADFELSETYERHPESPLECPMTVYGGLEDHEVEAGQLAAWSEMTAATILPQQFAGDFSANLHG